MGARAAAAMAGASFVLVLSLVLAGCAHRLADSEPALALEDIAAGSADSRLKQRTASPARQTLSYQVEGRARAADLYLGGLPPRAGIVLVPGVVPAGKDDARLVALASTLARLDFAVLVPDIEGLRRYQVRGSDVSAVADALRYLLSQPALAPQGRAGVAGFSYGAGPVLLAALQPDIRERVRFLVAMGGYYDLRRVVSYFTTGYYRDPDSGAWQHRPANPYAARVFAWSNTDLLRRPADRAWLRAYVNGELGKAAAPGLAADAQAFLALLDNRDPDRVPALIDALPAAIRAELDALDPAAHDLSKMQAQVLLVHGREDRIIPYTESLALAAALPEERTRLFVIDGVAHVDVRLREQDVERLLAAMTLLLAQRAPHKER